MSEYKQSILHLVCREFFFCKKGARPCWNLGEGRMVATASSRYPTKAYWLRSVRKEESSRGFGEATVHRLASSRPTAHRVGRWAGSRWLVG
jgi:hypothetical protein